jgi:hypothetical protein
LPRIHHASFPRVVRVRDAALACPVAALPLARVCHRQVQHLHRQFASFGEAVVGLAAEQNELYLLSTNGSTRGVNGGVQLLDLERMRVTPHYDATLDAIAAGTARIGRNGDQSLYTMLMYVQPSLVKYVHSGYSPDLT